MKKITLFFLCILVLLISCSCGSTDSNYSDEEIQKTIDEKCEFVMPAGFKNADYSYGCIEDDSETVASANEDFSVSYTNENKKITYTVHLEVCKDGQEKSYYRAITNTPGNGQIIEFDKKGDSSTLKNMRVDNIRGEEDSTLYSYYILAGENVIRITASSMEGENIKDTKENLSEFKTFLRTIKVK